MRFQHQRRRADEAEIPAEPEHEQGRPEMRRVNAGQTDDGGGALPAAALRRPPRCAEPRDQRPVKKLGPYIATTCHWMPVLESLMRDPHIFMASGAEVITRFIIG